MKVKKFEKFQNKIGSKGCKWSSLNAPGTETPVSPFHPNWENFFSHFMTCGCGLTSMRLNQYVEQKLERNQLKWYGLNAPRHSFNVFNSFLFLPEIGRDITERVERKTNTLGSILRNFLVF